MARQFISVAFLVTLASTVLVAHAQDPLEQIAKEELDHINAAFGLESTLNFADSDEISASPNGTIYFPGKAVKEIERQTNAVEGREVLRFMLAHEQTHERQFKTYGVNAVRPTDPLSVRVRQISRIKECQADILGAKYLMESLYQIDQPDSSSQSMVSETIREVLKVAFNLGVKERDAYYPPPDQRLTAARLGMSRGILDKLRQYASDPRFVASARQLERVLDVRAGEDALRWSLRLAKRIVHYDDASVQALTLTDEGTSDFNGNATSGMASFRRKYANSGNTAISVDMEVQCVTARKEDPDDVFSWEKWSVRNFQFRLEPGAEHIVSGVLPWDLGGNGKIARLIIPVKDKEALLSVEPVD